MSYRNSDSKKLLYEYDSPIRFNSIYVIDKKLYLINYFNDNRYLDLTSGKLYIDDKINQLHYLTNM
jgi:hypothetical protein